MEVRRRPSKIPSHLATVLGEGISRSSDRAEPGERIQAELRAPARWVTGKASSQVTRLPVQGIWAERGRVERSSSSASVPPAACWDLPTWVTRLGPGLGVAGTAPCSTPSWRAEATALDLLEPLLRSYSPALPGARPPATSATQPPSGEAAARLAGNPDSRHVQAWGSRSSLMLGPSLPAASSSRRPRPGGPDPW